MFVHSYDRVPAIWNESIAKSTLHKFNNRVIINTAKYSFFNISYLSFYAQSRANRN